MLVIVVISKDEDLLEVAGKIPRDALYIAVLVGKNGVKNGFQYLKALYDRLVNNFKPKKVAIVACMRKLLEVCHKLIQQKRCFVI